MNNLKSQLDQIPWETPAIGAQQKVITGQGKQVRLLRFTDTFVEPEWCTKGHIGYMVEGTMTVNFNGNRIAYKAGDVLWIEPGENHKHKVEMSPGESVTLFLYEEHAF